MPRWATLVEIAGVSFTGCRAVIVDGQPFNTSYRGSGLPSADGTPYMQRISVGVKNVAFGINFVRADADKLSDVLTAIQAAEAAGNPFVVAYTDALYTLDLLVWPDYNQRWYSHGPESEDMIDDVTFRFLSVANNV